QHGEDELRPPQRSGTLDVRLLGQQRQVADLLLVQLLEIERRHVGGGLGRWEFARRDSVERGRRLGGLGRGGHGHGYLAAGTRRGVAGGTLSHCHLKSPCWHVNGCPLNMAGGRKASARDGAWARGEGRGPRGVGGPG